MTEPDEALISLAVNSWINGRVVWPEANLRDADLRWADLIGADLRRADLIDAFAARQGVTFAAPAQEQEAA